MKCTLEQRYVIRGGGGSGREFQESANFRVGAMCGQAVGAGDAAVARAGASAAHIWTQPTVRSCLLVFTGSSGQSLGIAVETGAGILMQALAAAVEPATKDNAKRPISDRRMARISTC
jgi:hypothetical protein